MQRVQLEVADAQGAIVLQGAFELPAILGRGQAASVKFDADRTVISRRHFEIKMIDGALHGVHLASTSETLIDDNRLRAAGESRRLAIGSVVVIGDHRVRIMPDPDALGVATPVPDGAKNNASIFAVVTTQNNGHWQAKSLPISAEGLLVTYDAASEIVALTVRTDNKADPVIVGRLQRRAEQGVLLLDSLANPPRVRINGAEIAGDTALISVFDLIEIGGLRIELVPDAPAYLSCANATCQRINVYRPGDNCRYCGFRLVESQSVPVAKHDVPR